MRSSQKFSAVHASVHTISIWSAAFIYAPISSSTVTPLLLSGVNWARHSRPRLYLHGLSLGAAGSEQSINFLMVLGDLVHGAVWSGPPFSNPNWSTFTQGRNPDSSFWLPTYGDGSLVRFTNQLNALDLPGARWGPVRLAYLQYASDPITFFSPDLFYQEPDWLKGKR
ncbi:MAG: alpha/beta-hydrolase family protein, partial [Planctomycetales bacterium]